MADENRKLPSIDLMIAERNRRQQVIRDQWVKIYEARLVRAELQKCVKQEGVNHYMVCKPLVEYYLDLLPDAEVKGWKKIYKEQDLVP